MRTLFKLLWKHYLRFCAASYLQRAHPYIIAIAGSVGKTTTKDVVFAALSRSLYTKRVRKSSGNLNNEFGVPLAILGFEDLIPASQIPFKAFTLLYRCMFYPKTDVLVLEYAVDHPGDLDYLCKLAPPNIAILTPIAEEHLEFIGDLDNVYEEETKLLKYLKPEGIAIVHFDKRLMQIFLPRRLTYGLAPGADLRIVGAEVKTTGTNLDVSIEGPIFPVRSPLLGIDQNQAVLAALAVCSALNADRTLAIEGITSYRPAPGRLRPIEGRDDVTIIDDSYNASPASMQSALKLLKQIGAKNRKVAILGTMRELGGFSESYHRLLGKSLPQYCDIAIVVGPFRNIVKESAVESGMAPRSIHMFEKPSGAKSALKELIKSGDIVLVKASQNTMRFENIVKSLMKNPDRAPDLLVRQEKYWQKHA